MEFNYSRNVAAPVDQVWRALTEPSAMEPHLPGTTRAETSGPDRICVSMKIKMGFLRPTVSVDVQNSAVIPNTSFDLEFAGKSMGAGVRGSATIVLSEETSGVQMNMSGLVKTSGLLTKVSDSQIEDAARGFLDDYLASVERLADSA